MVLTVLPDVCRFQAVNSIEQLDRDHWFHVSILHEKKVEEIGYKI